MVRAADAGPEGLSPGWQGGGLIACIVNCSNQQGISNFHPAVSLLLYGDGSVRPNSETALVDIVFALHTRSGGEIIPGQ